MKPEQLFREFEKRIQDARAATIIYSGQRLTRIKGKKKSRILYGGSWQVKPGGKIAKIEYNEDGHSFNKISGGLELTESRPFTMLAPRNFFIGPITRNGFFLEAQDNLQNGLGLAKHVTDFRLMGRNAAADPPGVKRIGYRLGMKEGLTCDVLLSVDEKTLAPMQRDRLVEDW